jgi:DNA polymerase III alpha subunit (gram-positive type)
MAACIYCGKSAGLFRTFHQECADGAAQQAAVAQKQAAKKVIKGPAPSVSVSGPSHRKEQSQAEEIVVFDVQTSGLDPSRHSVIQFAGLAVEIPSWRALEASEVKIRCDEAKADPEALRVNRYDRELWKKEAVTEAAALTTIARFLERHATLEKMSRAGEPYYVARPCGHNSRFDAEFLYKWFKRADEFLPAAAYEALDTLALSHWTTSRLGRQESPADHKLATLCSWCGIPQPTPGDALTHAHATAQLAKSLLGRLRSAIPEYP